jgi:hypothetical protein
MSQFIAPGPQRPYYDRTFGLVFFGIVQILLGGLCGLMVPLMALGMVMGAKGGVPVDARSMVPAMMIYPLMAAVLVSLGIGSVLCRRWARALSLVFAWLWLVVGLAGLAFSVVFLPGMFQGMGGPGNAPPREVFLVILAITFGILGCVYVVIPGVLVLFYRSPHVRATCEAKDPQVRWTDRCPLPVLALSVIWGFAAFSVLWMLGYGGVFPLFGVLVSGPVGLLVILALAVAFGYLAWGTYRLKMPAWWGSIALVAALAVSAAVTFSRVGLMDLYRAWGMTPEQLRMIEQTGMVGKLDALMPWSTVVAPMILLGYILFTRRYFTKARVEG